MPFQSLLAADRIVLLVEAGDRDGVLDAAARLLSDASPANTQAIADSLRKRERLGSTAIGHGIAIPHGKLAGLKRIVGIFARLAEPIEFDAVDGEKVDIVFLLLAPEGAGADHLKALARISRLLREGSAVEKLRASRDAAALYAVLTEEEASSHAA